MTTRKSSKWIAAIALCLSSFASAASFDCQKAATPTEKAICADAGLSALDSELAKAYKQALGGDKAKADFVRDSERGWIDASATECNDSVDCLTERYQARITFLKDVAQPERAGSDFALNNIARHHRFGIHMFHHCAPENPDYDTCTGPGRLTITSNDNAHAPQVILVENIKMPFIKGKQPLANSAMLYEEQGVINVGDFNFDGREDFAIQTGDGGSYGGPSYDVYLDKGGKFVYSASLSSLQAESLGFFGVDPVKHQLTTLSKSGCCWHESSVYSVVKDEPVAIEHTVEQATESDEPFTYTERMINGRWKRVSMEGKRPADYCEQELTDAITANGSKQSLSPAACKLLPNEPKIGVAVSTFSNDDRHVGLDVFFVNIDSGKVLAQSSMPNAYTAPDGVKGYYPSNSAVDTARYQLTPSIRAVGVRTAFAQHTGYELLTLMVRQGSNIVPVLDNLVTAITDDKRDTKRVLEMGKSTSNGYADIIIHETVQNLADSADVHQRDYMLHFDGKHYVLPAELERHPS